MELIKKTTLPIVILSSILLISPCFNSTIANGLQNNPTDTYIIKVAIYVGNGDEGRYARALNYSWISGDTTYKFESTIIDGKDVLGQGENDLTTDNFDVLMIGASARSYLVHGQSEKWKENVRDFVASGGGYYGVCGGANAASRGFENPKNLFHKLVNRGVLGIANVYINDYLIGEWQYLFKFSYSGFFNNHNSDKSIGFVDVNTTVSKSNNNKIFSEYDREYRHIAYAGGPGMYNTTIEDSKYGPIVPLLTYNEELMDSKPLHYYVRTLRGWKIFRNVTTTLYDTFAGIATTYEDGRVVTYGPHPELRFVVNGSIVETRGFGYLSFVLGRYFGYSYLGDRPEYTNYWLMLRSIAWAAKIPNENLPPTDDTIYL